MADLILSEDFKRHRDARLKCLDVKKVSTTSLN
jgi:hypothetical protein